MEIGKLPGNVLKRTVFKQIKQYHPEVLLHPGIGEDCAALAVAEDEMLVFSTDPITAASEGRGGLAVHNTANDLASSGAEPAAMLLTILLPPGIRERKLKLLMEEVSFAANQLSMEIIGGHTEVSEVVNRPLLSVTGIGRVKKNRLVSTDGLRPGDELVMTKWAGLEGTSILAIEKYEELLKRIPERILKEAGQLRDRISVLPESRIAVEIGTTAMHDASEGGIFGALWELGEAAGVGITVDLESIPIRQDTVEICEYFGINPYLFMSGGSLLIGTPKGNLMVESLQEQGIPAAVIGRATEGNDRIIRSGEEIRYIEPSERDHLYKVISNS